MKLRRLMESDAEGMLEWMNDPSIQQWFRFCIKEKKEVLDFIRRAEIIPVEGKSIHYAVSDDEENYLGTISLKNVNLSDCNAEYSICIRKESQGKGIGLWATETMLKKAFEDFKLERVYLNVLSENINAIRLYEKVGFVYEGKSRNCVYLRGKYRTLKWYSMLKTEYIEKYKNLKV